MKKNKCLAIFYKVLKKKYPFKSNYIRVDLPNKKEKVRIHFIDEGNGHPILMIHNGVTWSFFYRNLINKLAKNHRVIVLDLVGYGLSEKPLSNFDYTMASQVDVLENFITELNLDSFDLVVHGWGATIGLGYAVYNKASVRTIILLNALSFNISTTKLLSVFGKISILNWITVRCSNLFLNWFFRHFGGNVTPCNKALYFLPYKNILERIGVQKFLTEIPFLRSKERLSWHENLEERLSSLCDGLHHIEIVHCDKESIANDTSLKEWQTKFPTAHTQIFHGYGLFMLENENNEVITHIERVLRNNE